MKYKITALNSAGKTTEFIEEAQSENALRAKVSNAGLYLAEFTALDEPQKNTISTTNKKSEKIKLKEWGLFAYQMRLLLKSGLTVDASLAEIKSIDISAPLNKFINELYDDVMSGGAVSAFFAKRNKLSPEYFIGLLKAGELTGDLTGAFERINSIIDGQLELKNKIISITIYPLILVCLSLVFFVFLVSHILPSITGIFNELNAELPLITRMVMALSDLTRSYGLFVFLLIILLFFLLKRIKDKIAFKLLIEKIKLRCPHIKKFYLNYVMIRITALCCALLQNNIPLLTVIRVALKSSGSPRLALKLEDTVKAVEAGETLNDALDKLKFFPRAFIRLVRTGEKTNTLPQIFSNLNQMYNEEMNTHLKIMTSVIEPVIMLFIGSVITVLILAVVIPVLKLRV